MATALQDEYRFTRSPYVLAWHQGHAPLPVRPVQPPQAPSARGPAPAAPPWLATGPVGRPFDFCAHVRRLCADIVANTPELYHVDVGRILFAFTQARNGRTHGLQARVTPLRFRDGRLTRRQAGVTFQVQRYFVDGREVYYLMTFCLPRFLNQDFDDKFVTLFHELFHISPAFDGDLRRHAGRCTVHSSSQRRYDERMAGLARAYLTAGPSPDLHAFLRLSYAQLRHRHGSVVGVVVPRPKLIPVPSPVAASARRD
jgi:hypothetical protein